jgi:hypothetical protein
VPLAFPSHQGLIAPLWRRWPHRFNALACCVGAAIPDVVDGLIGIGRGHLGQGWGHSLFGLFALCLPVGLIMNAALKEAAPRIGGRLGALLERTGRSPSLAVEAWSIWVGALSHLVFDFVSHENFLWLYPWYETDDFFPSWWRARWTTVDLPFYSEPYPCGPHLMVWMTLNVAGAMMLLIRRRQAT